jgi:hypothetical protein
MARTRARSSMKPEMRKSKVSSQGGRISEFLPGFDDRILRMTPAQLGTYVVSSRHRWDRRMAEGGDLYDQYK